MEISFDAVFSINGDTSPSASGSSSFYGMVNYGFALYDGAGVGLGGVNYAAATTRYPYSRGNVEFRPNGLQHYQQDIDELAASLGIDCEDVESVRLSFKGYSSYWGGDNMIVRFDNVTAVPEPATAFLLGAGLLGLAVAGHERS